MSGDETREMAYLPAEDDPIAAAPIPVSAHEHAATLMLKDKPCGQGPVQVWSPDRTILHRRALEVAGILAAVMALIGFDGSTLRLLRFILARWNGTCAPWLLVVCVFILSSGITWLIARRIGALPALLRTCFITTDSAGMAISNSRGAVAFLWDDLVGVREDSTGEWMLNLRSGKRIRLNLIGYRPEDLEQIAALMRIGADLRFVRAGACRRMLPRLRFFARKGYHRQRLGFASDTPSLPGAHDL